MKYFIFQQITLPLFIRIVINKPVNFYCKQRLMRDS